MIYSHSFVNALLCPYTNFSAIQQALPNSSKAFGLGKQAEKYGNEMGSKVKLFNVEIGFMKLSLSKVFPPSR
jgi:hypothetical protein